MTDLNGKKVLVLAGPDFEDAELIYPKIRMIEAGADVKVAGLGEKTYKGKHGYPVSVDMHVQDAVDQRWDVVVVPGGWAPDKIRMSKAALSVVQATLKHGGVVSAICHGGWVLASADVIRGKKVTSYIAIKDDMVNAGGHWVDEAVVVDSNIVTSRTPDDLPQFCQAIIQLASRQAAAVS
jgi:protease I